MSVSGKYMSASINGVVIFDNYAWNMDEGGDMLDHTTGARQGWEYEDMGVQNGHFTVKGFMDVALGQYTPVRRGTILTDVALYRDQDDINPAFTIAECIVARSTQGGEVKGKIEWTADIHSRTEVIANDAG